MMNSHGSFVWYVLMTTDMEAAKAFYTKVVGWGSRDASMPGLPYTVFTAAEAPVSAVMNLPNKTTDERPVWIGYVSVNDVDATANRVKQLGGAVHAQPQDILNLSRFSVVADPQKATLALFNWLRSSQEQAADPQRPVGVRTRGRVGWHELHAADWEQAWAFYSELFGWQKAGVDVVDTGPYQLFSARGQLIGAMHTKAEMVPVPFWLYYFNVGDIDAAVRRIKAGNGQILRGPVEAPDGNWIVQCTDPQGAIFALLGHSGVGYFERLPPARKRPDIA
jgi:predicted enzyme related to lactoylglutathione lyase